jgi:Uncharacterised nucleotidyltransferase
MRNGSHPIRLLTRALCGELPHRTDWSGIIEVANKGWLAPALYLALEQAGTLNMFPEEASDYLRLLHELNRKRNLCLRAQLLEAIRSLNVAGIQPILLKGCVHLFGEPGPRLGARMMSDIDLNIAPDEFEHARTALLALGYEQMKSWREFGRPKDAGTLELHLAPSRRSRMHLASDLSSSCRRVEYKGAVALVPDPNARALHLVVHDMIKDGDYWRLRIDLRHLYELAELATNGVDWANVAARLSDVRGVRALKVQAHALHDLFGVAMPEALLKGRRFKIVHLARLQAAQSGVLSSPLRTLGTISWGYQRLRDGYRWKGIAPFFGVVRRAFSSRAQGSKA